ncbi:type II toxin-antitoxin system RelE/ParE family toxin [Streptomyces sp. NPDC096013]|uniref:type II toxin-antitoxin system RelE/ParE family toxin n=1 Tax=Streptomyces sp. NPDC096013 TaxID=3366069 RepID=UPI0037FB43BF
MGHLRHRRGLHKDRRPRPWRARPRGAGTRRPRGGWTGLGRPRVDTISGSAIHNLKELRAGTVRILFTFAPWRPSLVPVAGDKRDRWNERHDEAIPLTEQRYTAYLKSRVEEADAQ